MWEREVKMKWRWYILSCALSVLMSLCYLLEVGGVCSCYRLSVVVAEVVLFGVDLSVVAVVLFVFGCLNVVVVVAVVVVVVVDVVQFRL